MGNKQLAKERIGDANVIRKNTAFASDVFQYLNDPSSLEAKQNILSLLSATQKSYQYKNILLLDKNKKIKLALNKYDYDLNKVHYNVINEATKKNDVVFSDFYRDEKTEGVHLSMAMPIVRFQKNNTINLGTVLIVIDPNIRLYPAIKLWPVPSETGRHCWCIVMATT